MVKVKLGTVARESKLKWTDSKVNIPIIGLEHIVPGELNIVEFAINSDNTFTKKFVKGQVLFGRRRAYQKKAAIADFDGICSGDITVIEAIEGKILPELLPFIVQNDSFFDYAVQGSAGSLSPRVKWSHLCDYEFDLPSIDEQRKIADKAWAAYRLKESYKKLLEATDDMVKAQFNKLFGTIEQTQPLSSFVATSFPGEWGKEDTVGTGTMVIRTTNFTNKGKLSLSDVVKRNIDPKKIEKKKLRKGDIILERSGGTSENPVGRVVYFNEDGTYLFNNFTQLIRCREDINSLYIFYSLYNYYHTNKNAIRSMGNKTTGIQNLKMVKYWKIPIAVASQEQQEYFEMVYNQAEKSKIELNKSISTIDEVIKSLINNQ